MTLLNIGITYEKLGGTLKLSERDYREVPRHCCIANGDSSLSCMHIPIFLPFTSAIAGGMKVMSTP